MGWRGTVRSMNAAIRAAERESQRRQKLFEKEQMQADAYDAVSKWKSHIHDLVSIHTNCADDINWEEVANRGEPAFQEPCLTLVAEAQEKLENFKPGIFDFLSGGSTSKRERLEQEVVAAQQSEELAVSEAKAAHEQALEEWRSDKELADRMLRGDPAAIREVIQEYQSLTGEDLLGKRAEFRINEDFVHAIVEVHDDSVVPTFRRKQLQSGRLSETKMPKGEFNELYQDYVASVATRVAGDLFGLLHDSEVFVTCTTLMLDKATGHQKQTPILSVHFVQDTMNRLNLDAIDPSDSLSNYNHSMDFKKTTGFRSTKPLKEI